MDSGLVRILLDCTVYVYMYAQVCNVYLRLATQKWERQGCVTGKFK